MAEGLELFRIINLVREYPLSMQPLFTFDPVAAKLTYDQLVELLNVVFSPQGSTKQVSEEATFMHWDEFLHDLSNGAIGTKYTHVYMFASATKNRISVSQHSKLSCIHFLQLPASTPWRKRSLWHSD